MGPSGGIEGVESSVVVTGPRVVASFPLGLRATLLDRGDWTAVRDTLERRDLDAALRLEGLGGADWLPLPAHLALLEAIAAVLGLDGIRELGFVRTQQNTMGGLFPTLLRSWVRSFRNEPASLLRIGPHIWQTAFREAGEVVIDDVRPAHGSLRIVRCPQLATSVAWQQITEGVSAGILHLAGLRERVTFRSDGVSTTSAELEWYAATGT
jgi:hypothetical protein